MIHLYWGMFCFLAIWAAFKLGWEKGVNDTLKYFTKHPIPMDWIEIR